MSLRKPPVMLAFCPCAHCCVAYTMASQTLSKAEKHLKDVSGCGESTVNENATTLVSTLSRVFCLPTAFPSMRVRNLIVIVLTASLFLSCGDEDPAPTGVSQGGEDAYAARIQPLFEHYCVTCHGRVNQFQGLILGSWDTLVRGSRYGEVVIPFDAENSLMIERMTKYQAGVHDIDAPHPGEHWVPYLTGDEIRRLALWIDAGARNGNGVVPYQSSRNRLYVANEGAGLLSVIDTEARLVIRSIKLDRLGYPSDARPRDVVTDPETGCLYVSLYDQDRVLKLDADYRLAGEAVVTAPGMMALDPARDALYVARFSPGRDVPRSLAVIRSSTMVQMGEIVLPVEAPFALAVDVKGGGTIYAAGLTDPRIFSIEAEGDDPEAAVLASAGEGLAHLVVSPDAGRLYVSAALSNELLVVDLHAGGLIARIPVGNTPWRVAVTPDGGTVFVGNLGANSVSVVDAAGLTEERTITGNGLAEPDGMALSADGRMLYVANRNAGGAYRGRILLNDNERIGTVVVINTATSVIEKVIEVEEYATGLALWP